jgi:hypothetical protein
VKSWEEDWNPTSMGAREFYVLQKKTSLARLLIETIEYWVEKMRLAGNGFL